MKTKKILESLERIETLLRIEPKFKRGNIVYKVINWLDNLQGIPELVRKVKIKDLRLYDNDRYEYYIIDEDCIFETEWTYYGLFSEKEIKKFKDNKIEISIVDTRELI